MSFKPNETDPRGTRAKPQPANRTVWRKRLLKAVFWAVWLIDKALRLISWLTGSPSG